LTVLEADKWRFEAVYCVQEDQEIRSAKFRPGQSHSHKLLSPDCLRDVLPLKHFLCPQRPGC